MSEREPELLLDRGFDLLAEKRRRHVIQYLQEETVPVAIADLAKRIADWESEEIPTTQPDLQDAVYRSLYHWHIPKLADAGVVAHNQDRNTVEPAANFPVIVRVWNSVSDVPDLEDE